MASAYQEGIARIRKATAELHEAQELIVKTSRWPILHFCQFLWLARENPREMRRIAETLAACGAVVRRRLGGILAAGAKHGMGLNASR